MSNQSSIEWLAEQLTAKMQMWNSTKNYQEFHIVLEAGEFAKLIEQAKAMHKEESEAKYQEGREIGKIEVLTSQSTKNASEYSQGYNKGFLAALEYMNSTIENKIKLRKYEQ